MAPKKAAAAKGKGKGKKAGDQDEGPQPADLVKKFKKAYNDACKTGGVVPYRPLVRKLDEQAEEGTIVPKITIHEENWGPQNLQPLLVGLRSFNMIEKFCFWNASLGDEGLLLLVGFIQNNPVVKTLELIDNITPLGCAYLAKMFEEPGDTQLKELTLDHSDIGDEGAIRLATGISLYPPLTKLNLNYCSIGASGGVAIAQLLLQPTSKSQIEFISLQGNICGPQTLAMFGQQLPNTKTLQSLNLADNGIGEDEEPLEFFRAGLVGNQSLVEINLDMNLIGDKAATQFLEVIGGPRQDITDFRVTDRLSPTVFADILKVIEANKVEAIARANKAKPKKKKAKKKK